MITGQTIARRSIQVRSIARHSALPLMLLALAGCRAVPVVTAPPQVLTTLYFGLGLPDGTTLSEADWNRFVETEIIPRFPDGFTIQPADGHWQHNGQPVHEPSRVFSVVHPIDVAADEKLKALRTIYCRRFQQDAVLRIDQPTSRVSF